MSAGVILSYGTELILKSIAIGHPKDLQPNFNSFIMHRCLGSPLVGHASSSATRAALRLSPRHLRQMHQSRRFCADAVASSSGPSSDQHQGQNFTITTPLYYVNAGEQECEASGDVSHVADAPCAIHAFSIHAPCHPPMCVTSHTLPLTSLFSPPHGIRVPHHRRGCSRPVPGRCGGSQEWTVRRGRCTCPSCTSGGL